MCQYIKRTDIYVCKSIQGNLASLLFIYLELKDTGYGVT